MSVQNKKFIELNEVKFIAPEPFKYVETDCIIPYLDASNRPGYKCLTELPLVIPTIPYHTPPHQHKSTGPLLLRLTNSSHSAAKLAEVQFPSTNEQHIKGYYGYLTVQPNLETVQRTITPRLRHSRNNRVSCFLIRNVSLLKPITWKVNKTKLITSHQETLTLQIV